MEQFDLYVHGVPIGHEICGCNENLDYIKGFYNHDVKVEVSSLLQIDIVNGKSFYTYLRKKNVRNAEGRPGSYFGLTVSFFNKYCTNVQVLYNILSAIHKQICVDNLIKTDSDGDRFMVKQISTCSYKNHPIVEYIKAAFRNNLENLHFDTLKCSENPKIEAKFNLQEVDSPLFHETLKNKRILVSPEYETAIVAYNNLLKEFEPIKNANVQLKRSNAQLTENKDNLSKEIVRLEKELADSTTSVNEKYKKQLEDLQTQLKECKQEKDKSHAQIEEATSTADSIGELSQKLTRLLAGRFQEKDEKVRKELSEDHSTNRTKHPKKPWISMGNIILLLTVVCLCSYCCYNVSKLSESVSKLSKSIAMMQNNTPQDIPTIADTTSVFSQTEESKTISETGIGTEQHYDNYKDCRIDISPSPDSNGRIKKEQVYTLSVFVRKTNQKATVPIGTWGGSSNVDIKENTFKVNNEISTPTNIQIYYIVNEKEEITRTITVE